MAEAGEKGGRMGRSWSIWRAASWSTFSPKQVADRFHLMQNLRDSIERQMEQAGRISVRARLSDAAAALHPAPVVAGGSGQAPQPDQRAKMLERVHELRKHGLTMRAIVAETAVGWFTVTRWIREGALPERARRVMRRTSPLFFHDFLSRQWSTGSRIGQHLLQDIRNRGYTEVVPTSSACWGPGDCGNGKR